MATRLRQAARLGAVAAVALLVAGTAMLSTGGRVLADGLEKMTLRLDWTPQGYHAPLFYGVAKGFYKEQGIDLEILDGKGSASTLSAISEGTDTIGIASLATMALGDAKGMPLIGVAALIQSMPDGVIALKSANITKPKDLEGKKFGFNPDDYGPRIFPAFAAANGINMDSIKKVQLGWGVINTALLQGNIDFMIGWEMTTALEINKQKPIGPVLKYADFGVNMYSGGFVVNRKTAADKAKLIRAFLAATAKSYDEGTKDPGAAVDALIAARPSSDRDVMLEQAKLTPPYLHTKNSAGHGFGWMAREDWDQTLQLLTKYFELPAGTDASKLYSNDFLPKS